MTKKKLPHEKKPIVSKLTAEMREKITKAIKLGAGVEQAAAYAGVTRQALYNWLKSPATQMASFQREVEQARGQRVVGWLMAMQLKADSEDKDAWKAAGWLLERTLPEQFGPRAQLARVHQDQPDVAELEAAAARGVTLGDGAVLWQRQLSVLEAAYGRGELDSQTYLEGMNRLAAQAARLAELGRNDGKAVGLPQVQLAFLLDSPAIHDAAPLPAGVSAPGRAAGGGDSIDAT